MSLGISGAPNALPPGLTKGLLMTVVSLFLGGRLYKGSYFRNVGPRKKALFQGGIGVRPCKTFHRGFKMSIVSAKFRTRLPTQLPTSKIFQGQLQGLSLHSERS